MLHVPQIHGAGLSGEGPRLWRTYSHPLILLACLAGTALIIQLIDLLLPASWAVTLLDRTRSTYPLTVQNLTWLAFGLGVGELIVRARDARAERAELEKGYLPEDETTVLQGPELRRIYALARASSQADSPSRERFLPRLIHRVVTQFQTSRSVDQANALLNSSLELFLHEIDLRYSLVRYIIWVIPALGFHRHGHGHLARARLCGRGRSAGPVPALRADQAARRRFRHYSSRARSVGSPGIGPARRAGVRRTVFESSRPILLG